MVVARVAADQSALVPRLLAKIQQIPIVDSHNHLPSPTEIQQKLADPRFTYDVAWVLGQSTYVAEFLPGTDWEEIKKGLAVNAHHAYYRPILQAFRDLYGLGPEEELDSHNVEKVQARMDAAHRRADWYDEVIKRANVAHIVWLNWDPRGREEMPAPYYHAVWNVDRSLVYVAGTGPGQPTPESSSAIDTIQKEFDVRLTCLADMEQLIRREIVGFFERGGMGLKSTSAYFRSLDFDDSVPRARAAAVFDKVLTKRPISGDEKTLLEDYLMTQVLRTTAKLKKPIQFHTGNQQQQNLVANSNPLELNDLLFSGKWKDVKFVLLHGGYPYVEEAILLTKYYKNAHLDLAWMALFSPSAAKRALADAIDLLDGRQLMFGTDAANLEEFYGVTRFTRQILAEVLAEKIESGYLTEETALQIARRVLCTNATELYGLEQTAPGK